MPAEITKRVYVSSEYQPEFISRLKAYWAKRLGFTADVFSYRTIEYTLTRFLAPPDDRHERVSARLDGCLLYQIERAMMVTKQPSGCIFVVPEDFDSSPTTEAGPLRRFTGRCTNPDFTS